MEKFSDGQYIEDLELEAFAAEQAALLRPSNRSSGRAAAAALMRGYRVILRAHADAERRFGDCAAPPAACEWLLDNLYMIQREYQAALPQLRRVKSLRAASGAPLISGLCAALVRSGCGKVTEERCKLFLDGFQSVTVLRRAELLLFPTALKCALIDGIARVCESLRDSTAEQGYAEALGALFTSLRLFSVLDAEKLLGSADITGAILAADPGGAYPDMSSATKQEYLSRIEKLARAQGVEEHEYARALIRKAKSEDKHLGFYLFKEPAEGRAGLYIAANVLITLFLSLLPAFIYSSPAAALLLLLPVSELVKSLIDYILLRVTAPRPLPRMNTEGGVPAQGRTICVMSVILDDTDYGRALEELRCACRSEGKNLCFGLLADLPASDSQTDAQDAFLLRSARAAVTALNRKYGGGFYLFTRPRVFDGTLYCGRERKRGAIMELAKLLCGKESELSVTGEADALSAVRYILTLDSDTRIYPGSAGELIGAAIHPLCKPVVDPITHVVVSGHALIHPRMETELSSANATDFALIFAGSGGSDPYGGLCGELYTDVFGSGGFAGKGLIDAAALLECMDGRIPADTVLSHDALEGAYLRGAYMSDTQFCDGFPGSVRAYYRRLHRWVRGDWQNLRWIAHRELRPIDRWRLFDSLRRSLISPMTLAAILPGFFLRREALAVAAWAALLALLTRLLLSLADRGVSRRERVRQRRYTRLLTGFGGAIVQTFIRLWLLPYDAWICLSAALTALWRILVSHRRLLQWQVSAHSGGEGLGGHIRVMWPSPALGLALLIFSPVIIGKSAGLMWLLSPAAAAALSLPAHRAEELSDSDRQYIRSAAAKSWQYFRELCTEGESFLPPDNYQEQPPVGLAHRTSPTNIGLALAAAVAAERMGIAQRSEALEFIRHIADTLERLPRFRGHLYNWYDTRTLRPLRPAYISTVDSGNLCAGLITTSVALRSFGETELAMRLRDLTAQMDFSMLFDCSRGLFYICYDAQAGRGAGGWYDLMASEAMLTSYIAVSRGEVPKKHWRRLSRAQLQKDGYRGLASWTGTMFEYLMPELFLPVYRGSLLYEGCKFCLYAQKRRVYAGKPWGISESAFYSLDAALSYRYKAHGCAALALKRGQDDETVVSPYSSFLALALEPENAAKNLRRLERFGAGGRYGFIEALDFTPSRCRSDDGEQVRCYMAHHLAMSIIAAANTVKDGCIQKLFMSEPSMRAHSLLLQERLPEQSVVIRRDNSPVPEKPSRVQSELWQRRGGAEDTALHCCVLSNGAYSIMSTNKGLYCPNLGDLSIYACRRPDEPVGDCLRLSAELNGKRTQVLPMHKPELWELGEECCRFMFTEGELSFTATTAVGQTDCGELHRLEVRSATGGKAEIRLSFRPLLVPLIDYVNHPAFWRLGIHAELSGACLLLHRLKRGECPELWLCAACTARSVFSADSGGGLGWLSDPFVTVTAQLELQSGCTSVISFAICAGDTREQALEGARRLLAQGLGEGHGSLVGASAARLGMRRSEVGAAMELIAPLWCNYLSEAAPARDLWQFGIAGTLPLICCGGRALEAMRLLKRFCLLKSCGVSAELVYLSDEQGEYQQPLLERVSSLLSSFGLEALLGSGGGVIIAPSSASKLIGSRAAVIIGETKRVPRPYILPQLSAPRKRESVPTHHWENNKFCYYVNSSLPPRAWQLVMTNGSFGYIATDGDIGGMWYQNAREQPLSAAADDPRRSCGPELIWLESEGKRTSIFAANDSLPCRVSYEPGCAHWDKELFSRNVHTSVFIPENTDARVIMISGAKGLRLHWYLEPELSFSGTRSLLIAENGGSFTAEDPDASLPSLRFRAAVSGEHVLKLFNNPPAMLFELVCGEVTVLCCGCCSQEELLDLCKPLNAAHALTAARTNWAKQVNGLTLQSGYPPLDRYMSCWAAYQSIACRLLARCSLYQTGGAIGFRDQLQDAVNLMLLGPERARERIVDCCRHQYVEGDVMHWWHPHPDGDSGVRTRCSDDMLWLVWALCEYTDATGDYGLCGESVCYVNSPPLLSSEKDRYEQPERGEGASVLEHSRAALDICRLRGFGEHGLPHFGSGDWNDALSDVDGESVWLGWFLAHCAARFAKLLAALGQEADEYRELSASVAAAADKARCGAWYLRGYYADGEPLGADDRPDCVSQSWAVLSALGNPEFTGQALDNVLCKLVDREHGLIKLLAPPYTASERSPGYIVSYGEGFRENGGQYTHGAVWLALACIESGREEQGFELLRMLLPDGAELRRYEAEPFVLAADVYAAPGHEGEAGWSWYTGSAGWYFRTVAVHMLGLRLRGGKLYVEPKLPPSLSAYTCVWRDTGGKAHNIEVRGALITVDGLPYSGAGIG